jgi:hypothetical protein
VNVKSSSFSLVLSGKGTGVGGVMKTARILLFQFQSSIAVKFLYLALCSKASPHNKRKPLILASKINVQIGEKKGTKKFIVTLKTPL